MPSAVQFSSHEDGLNQQLLNNKFQDRVKPSSSCNEGSSNSKAEDHVLEPANAEMGEVREENERLKMMLQQMEKDYNSLKLRFFEILQQESFKNSADSSAPSTDIDIQGEPDQLVSLCLGRNTETKKEDKEATAAGSSSKGTNIEDEELKASLSLGLESKFQISTELVSNPSPTNSLEQGKEDEAAGETWPPSKIQKRNVDDEVAQQSNAKRARVCVRARCDTPTMNDGCQWRKYGQKIAKGNPCPRAYYRCTVAPACPVRKQVQRCADDMSILITTYEGTHNHPLSVSATAMASTTSAAASMLLSGSSTSQLGLNSHAASTSAAHQLNGLNFSLYDNSRTKQVYLVNPSSSSLFPTITLDLTSSPSTSYSPFNRFSSTSRLIPSASTSLSFSASDQSNMFPTVWGNGYQGNNYIAQMYQQPFMKKNHVEAAASQQALTETLKKAITSDPSFKTVIAAAISSMMGTGSSASSSSSQGKQVGTESIFSQNLKLGEPNQVISTNSLTQKGKGCASSYFNGLSSVTSEIGISLLQPSSLPFSIFNSASTPTANNDHKS